MKKKFDFYSAIIYKYKNKVNILYSEEKKYENRIKLIQICKIQSLTSLTLFMMNSEKMVPYL